MELNLTGLNVLITGGSHGIGLAIKLELEKEGAKVVSVSLDEGFDVMKPEDMQKIGELAQQADILINNVGGGGTWKIEDWEDVFYKNFTTAFILTMAFLKPDKDWGRVVTISSIYGKEKGGTPWFNASKAAQISLMKNLAGKYPGITFNTICPGHIDVGKEMPGFTGNPGKPEDVAGLVTFLCSDKAKWINGATITVDNGESFSF
jgi:3-oxoacyl-[acyl-carrier protein] reductase